MSATLTVCIPALLVDAAKDFVTFKLLISKGEDSWGCQRRFADFVKLHASVRSKTPDIPDLPPKGFRMGKSKFDPDFLEDRRVKLESYLQSVVSLLPPEMCEALDEFLLYAQQGLRETLERLGGIQDDSGEVESAMKLLREAGELGAGRGVAAGGGGGGGGGAGAGAGAAATAAGSGGGAGGKGRKDSSDGGGGGGEDGGASTSASASAAALSTSPPPATAMIPLIKQATRVLANFKAGVASRAEDKEQAAAALSSGSLVLENRLKARREDVSESKAALGAAQEARAAECGREGVALGKCGVAVRTVAGELGRVERECGWYEGVQAGHKRVASKVRGVLGGWEGGGGTGEAGGASATTSAATSSSTSTNSSSSGSSGMLSQECSRVESEGNLSSLGGLVTTYTPLVDSAGGVLEGLCKGSSSGSGIGSGSKGVPFLSGLVSKKEVPHLPTSPAPNVCGPDQVVAQLLHTSAVDTLGLITLAGRLSNGKGKLRALPPPVVAAVAQQSPAVPAQFSPVSGGGGGGNKHSSGNNSSSSSSGSKAVGGRGGNSNPFDSPSHPQVVGNPFAPHSSSSSSSSQPSAGKGGNPFDATNSGPSKSSSKSVAPGKGGNPF